MTTNTLSIDAELDAIFADAVNNIETGAMRLLGLPRAEDEQDETSDEATRIASDTEKLLESLPTPPAAPEKLSIESIGDAGAKLATITTGIMCLIVEVAAFSAIIN